MLKKIFLILVCLGGIQQNAMALDREKVKTAAGFLLNGENMWANDNFVALSRCELKMSGRGIFTIINFNKVDWDKLEITDAEPNWDGSQNTQISFKGLPGLYQLMNKRGNTQAVSMPFYDHFVGVKPSRLEKAVRDIALECPFEGYPSKPDTGGY